MKDLKTQSECKRCGLLLSTVQSTGKGCLTDGFALHDFGQPPPNADSTGDLIRMADVDTNSVEGTICVPSNVPIFDTLPELLGHEIDMWYTTSTSISLSEKESNYRAKYAGAWGQGH